MKRWKDFSTKELKEIYSALGIASSESLVINWELFEKLEKELKEVLEGREK